MAGQKQGSARVTLREIDLSQVGSTQVLPQGVPAAVVGTAKKGPAFVPQTFANMQQFTETFGSMSSRGRLDNSNLLAPLAFNEWMRNSQAGTFLRVLGVGDGDADATGSGFVVGNQLVQPNASGDNKNKVYQNQHATITDSDAARTTASQIARTHILGCFMKDVENSRVLSDSGLQKETSSAKKVDIIDVSDNVANGDQLEIFLPKEVVNSVATTKVTSDITLTIRVVTNIGVVNLGGSPFTDVDGRQTAADLEDNLIVVNDNDTGATVADYIKLALNQNIAAGNSSHDYDDVGADGNDVLRFNKLSINPSEIFTAVDGTGNKITITLNSTRKEGDEVFIVETAGTSGNLIAGTTALNEKVFFSGAALAAPVIRGILMAPQGVKPSLDVSDDVKANYDDYVAGTDLTVEVNANAFGNGNGLVGYSIGDVTSDSFKVILNGFNNIVNSEYKNVYTCSFDPQADNYFAKVLNTDPAKIEELGHYLYAHWDIEKTVAIPSRSGLLNNNTEDADYDNMIGFLVSKPKGAATDYEKFEGRYATAKTPWLVSQFYSSANNSDRPDVSKDKTYDLFRLHVLDDGECGNDLYRVLISDLRYEANDFGTFTLTLEKYDSDSISGTPVITWRQLSLDPDHRNFIGRVIGDKHMYYDFDQVSGNQRLRQSGLYEVTNKYVRVELSTDVQRRDVPVDTLPSGFKGHAYPLTTNAFTEEGTDSDAILVFSGAGDVKIDKLADAQVSPLPYVDSVSRKVVGTTLEAESELAWGVKFGIKKNVDLTDPKELTENEFNKSLLSWAKFYPSAILKDGDDADSFQNSFFSLEKIQIPSGGLDSSADISSWDNALYKRDGKYDSADAGRFVTVSSDAKGANVKFLKFRCMFQGGWDGVNIFDKEKAELSNVAAEREGRDETGTSKITGPTVMAYRKAVDVLSDKSAAEFQLLVLPGQRSSSVTDYAIDACETRFDAMLVMDVEEYDSSNDSIAGEEALPHVTNTRKKFEDRLLDTSFAAAYFPNVVIRRTSDGAPLEVPPSVAMIGVMSRNDAIEAPWFAPAGLSRGTLINSIDSKVQMNRQLLDDLYDADINPIYVPAGRPGEVYAFGQKTLLQNQSALDRINVRRLLIDIRRKVRVVGEQLLFEPNRESTLQRFSSLVEPIMQDVQRRRGVVRYKVQIDTSTTTQNDIENNTIRGKIYLQPTKSVEFISLDFVVANTID